MSGDIPDDGTSNETIQFLFRKKYLIRYHPTNPDGSYSETSMRSITDIGKEALYEFDEFTEKSRKESAAKKSEKKSDRRFQLLNTLLGAVIGSVATLFIEHFPEIAHFVWSLFQRLTP